MTEVSVTSDLAGTIFYHWYIDGTWIASTNSAVYAFRLPAGDEARIEAIDTNDAAFDPIANAPAGWPARKTLFWTASIFASIDRYRVDQQQDGGDWATIGYVDHIQGQWCYSLVTDRLVDLAEYAWRIYPVDVDGNAGTHVELAAEKIVRIPDGPDFEISFDAGTTKVTISAAA